MLFGCAESLFGSLCEILNLWKFFLAEETGKGPAVIKVAPLQDILTTTELISIGTSLKLRSCRNEKMKRQYKQLEVQSNGQPNYTMQDCKNKRPKNFDKRQIGTKRYLIKKIALLENRTANTLPPNTSSVIYITASVRGHSGQSAVYGMTRCDTLE